MRILVSDTETTDLDESAEICEVAFIEVDENLNVLSKFCSLVNPKGLISPAAAGASGITNRMVENEPTIEQVLERFPPDYFKDVMLLAHNCKFDARMLAPFWGISSTLCTLRAARHWFPDAPNHKLQTLRHYLEMEIDCEMHRAEADVEVLLCLLRELITVSGAGSLAGLIEIESKPRKIEIMPFGKHKGVALKDLPGGYVGWLLDPERNLEEDLRVSLQNRFEEPK